MKPIKIIIILLILLSGCKTIKYVPVETTKIEYRDRDRVTTDTIFKSDSIYVKVKGDTVSIERFKTVFKFRDKYVRDSIFIHDSIRVPYPVEVIKEVNKLSKWQSWQLISFRILATIMVLFVAYRLFWAKVKSLIKL